MAELSSAVQPPNTESDKSIDTILDKIPLQFNKPPRKWGEFRSEIKSQLLAEILKEIIGENETVGYKVDLIMRNKLRSEQRAKLNELFNEKEK